MVDSDSTRTTGDRLVTENLGAVVGYGVLVAAGTLLVVVGVRDLWVVLEAGFRAGPVRATARVLTVTAIGTTLLLAGAMRAGYLVAVAARE